MLSSTSACYQPTSLLPWEMEDEKREMGDERRVTRDGRQETGDGRREMGDGRRAILAETFRDWAIRAADCPRLANTRRGRPNIEKY